MKRLLKKIEGAMAAVAFAEAGEFETAREIMREQPDAAQSPGIADSTTIDDLISMAITFAEAGEYEKAKEILKEAEDRFGQFKEKISHGFFVSAKSAAYLQTTK
jgi:cellobiose-specific phosphotransferase system component IIA